MDCFGTYFTHCTKLFEVLQNGLFCYTLFTQSRDNVRVESATEWTASVHTSHMPKAVITFVFKMLLGALLNFRVFAFSRFRVFAFSRSRVFVFSGFRRLSPPVFAFSCSAGGIPAAGTQSSCAQHMPDASTRNLGKMHPLDMFRSKLKNGPLFQGQRDLRPGLALVIPLLLRFVTYTRMLKSCLNHLFCSSAYGAADFDKSCLLLKTHRHCNIFCAMWLMFPYLHDMTYFCWKAHRHWHFSGWFLIGCCGTITFMWLPESCGAIWGQG